METYENILVVIEEQNFVTKAIYRAINLAQRSHGKINILLLKNNSTLSRFTNYITHKGLQELNSTLNGKKSVLIKLIDKLKVNGINISSKLITSSNYSTVLQEAEDNSIDTVILAASSHNFWNAYQVTPIDFYLIGHCPYPLLIIKDHEWETEGRILSAVEVFNNKSEHQQLTKKVLEETEHFSQLLGGDCHTLDCYFGEDSNMRFELSHAKSNKENHLSMMKKHCQHYHLPFEKCHLSLELPENAITQLSAEIDPELIIIGDCGHRGLLNKFSVHVSEEVLNNINCDLLILKP